MRLWLVLGVGACVACGPGARDVPPDAGFVPPPGVWEPAPGTGRGMSAVALGDDGTLWWAVGESTVVHDLTRDFTETRVWLTQTSLTGESLLTPALVDPRPVGTAPVIAARGDKVVVEDTGYTETEPSFVRVFDRTGQPVDGGAHDLALVPHNGVSRGTSLAIDASGTMRIVHAFEGETGEVAIVDLDASGAPLQTTVLGSADDGTPSRLAVGSRADDSLVIAWDRVYDQCFGPRPSQTLTTSMGTQAGPLVPVGDLPERGELEPSIATSGDTQYIAWVADRFGAGTGLALARYPDVSTPLAVFGDETQYNRMPQLALAAPDRGALIWEDAQTSSLRIVSFAQQGTTLVASAPRDLAGDQVYGSLSAFIHVGDDRYLVAWIAATTTGDDVVLRLLATVIDLSGDDRQPVSPRIVPPTDPQRAAPRPRTALGLVPCSH